jgi:hypothetical protein
LEIKADTAILGLAWPSSISLRFLRYGALCFENRSRFFDVRTGTALPGPPEYPSPACFSFGYSPFVVKWHSKNA